MKFHVAQLLKEPVGTSREYDVYENIESIGDIPLASPLTGHVRLMHTNRGVLVKGTLRTDVVLECSRCLTEFTLPVELNINDQFWQKVDIYTGRAMPLPEGEEHDLEIDENHILDLSEAVRQYLLVNLPIQPLCSEACLGMCPQCGANLNEGLCNCAASNGASRGGATDSRLAALARLLEPDEK